MARPVRWKPSNLPESPRLAKTPEREAELLKVFLDKVDHISTSYAISREAEASTLSYNESIRRLKKVTTARKRNELWGDRVHPAVETAINIEARNEARRTDGTVDQRCVEIAAARVARKASPLRGRPPARQLEYHVTALMAAIQSATGLPVVERRYSDLDQYDPHFPSSSGRTLQIIVQHWDEGITDTQLVDLVRKIRRKYADKPMRFEDFFPLFGARINDQGLPQCPAGSGKRVEKSEINFPIYCP